MQRTLHGTTIFKAIMATLIVCVLMALSVAVLPQIAFADGPEASKGAKVYYLAPNKTCKKVDVTGDKKADAVKIKFRDSSPIIYVNGKKIYQANKNYIGGVWLVALKDKTGYLSISLQTQRGKIVAEGLYQCKGGKLKSILDYKKPAISTKGLKNCGQYLERVSGNNVICLVYGEKNGNLVNRYLTYAKKGNSFKLIKVK